MDTRVRAWASLAMLLVGGGAAAGCTSTAADDVFAEEQVSSDALPRVDSVVLESLDPTSSRLLGEAEGTRYRAVRNFDGEFCVLGQVVDGDPADMVTGCGPGDGDTLSVSLGTGPKATWSSVAGPSVPEGGTLLRGHLVVTPR